MTSSANKAPLKTVDRETEKALYEGILKAVSGLKKNDLVRLKAWKALDGLSPATKLAVVDVNPQGVFTDGSKFSASANVYVILDYGGAKGSVSESFPALIMGKRDNDSVKVDSLKVDVSSF